MQSKQKLKRELPGACSVFLQIEHRSVTHVKWLSVSCHVSSALLYAPSSLQIFCILYFDVCARRPSAVLLLWCGSPWRPTAPPDIDCGQPRSYCNSRNLLSASNRNRFSFFPKRFFFEKLFNFGLILQWFIENPEFSLALVLRLNLIIWICHVDLSQWEWCDLFSYRFRSEVCNVVRAQYYWHSHSRQQSVHYRRLPLSMQQHRIYRIKHEPILCRSCIFL